MGRSLFISKYLLFIGYIQNALTVNFHTIFIIVRNSSAPVTNDPPWRHRRNRGGSYTTNVAVKVLTWATANKRDFVRRLP